MTIESILVFYLIGLAIYAVWRSLVWTWQTLCNLGGPPKRRRKHSDDGWPAFPFHYRGD